MDNQAPDVSIEEIRDARQAVQAAIETDGYMRVFQLNQIDRVLDRFEELAVLEESFGR